MKVENSKHNKLFRISILVILTIVLIPSLFSLTKKLIDSAKEKADTNLSFEKIKIEFENIYSKNIETQIREFINNQLKDSTLFSFDQNEFYKKLKNNFSIIKKFECRIDALVLNIKIVGVQPYCIINNNWVMGNKKQLFNPDLFDQFDLTILKQISISDNEHLQNPLQKDIYNFIKQIPDKYWVDFDINFIKFTEIYLTPKNQSLNYSLRTDQKNIFNEQKITKAQELYKKLMRNNKKRNNFVLDLRFKNRIVTNLMVTSREGG